MATVAVTLYDHASIMQILKDPIRQHYLYPKRKRNRNPDDSENGERKQLKHGTT